VKNKKKFLKPFVYILKVCDLELIHGTRTKVAVQTGFAKLCPATVAFCLTAVAQVFLTPVTFFDAIKAKVESDIAAALRHASQVQVNRKALDAFNRLAPRSRLGFFSRTTRD